MDTRLECRIKVADSISGEKQNAFAQMSVSHGERSRNLADLESIQVDVRKLRQGHSYGCLDHTSKIASAF